MTSTETRGLKTRLALACCASVLGASSAFAQPVQSVPDARAPTSAEKVQALKAVSARGIALEPLALGSFSSDTVYTPVTPCRIVDTRVAGAGGALTANTTRTFDVDGTTFVAQGGLNGSCGIPFGQAAAVAMTITSVSPVAPGVFVAWGLGTKPIASVLNFSAGQIVANTTIVPVVPGTGNDFSVASTVGSNVVIDVVGYFAAPVATALDCTSVASAVTAVPYNAYTSVDATCPTGYTVTGGGTYPTEGTLGRPNIWTDGSPISNGWRTWVDNQTGSSRTIQTYARCCRVPGR